MLIRSTIGDIQQKINSAAYGDTIVFEAGSYSIDANTIQMKDGVSLKAKTMPNPDDPCDSKVYSVTITGTSTLISAFGAGDAATIEGFRLEGNTTNVGIWVRDVSPVITNNEIVTCLDGVRVAGGATAPEVYAAPSINNNCIHASSRYGIANSFESTAIIASNEIYNNSKHGIGIRDSAAPQIKGNRIYGNSEAGIGNRGQSYATISENNLIYSNAHQGIAVRDKAAPNIQGNKIRNHPGDGIGIRESATPIIINNFVYSNGKNGIAVRGYASPTISNNDIYQNGTAGVGSIEFAATKVYNNNIYNNSGVGVGFGDASNPYQGSEVVISGNKIYGNSGITEAGGIGITNATNAAVTITNNEIYNHTGKSGIAFRNSTFVGAGVTISGCSIHDNDAGIKFQYNSGPINITNGNDIYDNPTSVKFGIVSKV